MHLANFIHQKSYERIVCKVRRHSITFIPTIVLFLFLGLVPLVLQLLLTNLFPSFLEGYLINILAVLFISIYYLSIILFFYTEFVSFYLDLLIITNDRIIHINQHSLFARTIAEMDLYQTQDVISEVKGFVASLFKYGHLTIQNASAVTKFQSFDVPDPDKLRNTILDLATEDRKFHNQEDAAPAARPVSSPKA
jgi:membrane protein YdbS with pleckstrin-like domain